MLYEPALASTAYQECQGRSRAFGPGTSVEPIVLGSAFDQALTSCRAVWSHDPLMQVCIGERIAKRPEIVVSGYRHGSKLGCAANVSAEQNDTPLVGDSRSSLASICLGKARGLIYKVTGSRRRLQSLKNDERVAVCAVRLFIESVETLPDLELHRIGECVIDLVVY